MSCEDLQLDDIVLLQLFKDQIMNEGLDQAKGGDMNYIHINNGICFLSSISIN